MKAITIYQPYASLIAEGHKVFITRAYYTQHRGPVAIHAARLADPDVFRPLFCRLSTMMELDKCGVNAYNVDDLPRSAIVAIGELVDIWEIEKSTIKGEVILRKLKNDSHQYHFQYRQLSTTITLDSKEAALGYWHKGCYAYEFRNVKPLQVPIPAKGAARLWDWEPEKENKENDDNV